MPKFDVYTKDSVDSNYGTYYTTVEANSQEEAEKIAESMVPVAEYAEYKELVARGIKHKTPREYPFGMPDEGEYPVYTYKVYCNDGTVWGYSSEDQIFIKE